MPVPDMWGKIKPEWVQANEMLRMRAVKNTRWMQELPFTRKALPWKEEGRD